MVVTLKNTIKTTNVFLLTLNGRNERLDSKIQQMIREMEALFGPAMWNHTVLAFTFLPYDHQSVKQRNKTGRTEDALIKFKDIC